jgi:hypothetical protein
VKRVTGMSCWPEFLGLGSQVEKVGFVALKGFFCSFWGSFIFLFDSAWRVFWFVLCVFSVFVTRLVFVEQFFGMFFEFYFMCFPSDFV